METSSTTTKLPQPTEPLPRLTKDEWEKAGRSLRLVKAGRLYVARFRLHEKEGALTLEWAESGGGQVCNT